MVTGRGFVRCCGLPRRRDRPPKALIPRWLAPFGNPTRDRREQRLNALLAELGQNPDHPDWLLLFDYVRLAREFPPSSLDVLRRLPTYPRTLALALLKADDQTLDRMVAVPTNAFFMDFAGCHSILKFLELDKVVKRAAGHPCQTRVPAWAGAVTVPTRWPATGR